MFVKVAKGSLILGLALALIMALAPPAPAQMTAEMVVEHMRMAYEEQMEGIDDLTITTNMGVTYQKRAEVNGRTFYKIRKETKGIGIRRTVIYDGEYTWSVDLLSGEVKKEEGQTEISPAEIWRGLERADVKFIGTETLSGSEAYVLSVTGMTEMVMEGMVQEPEPLHTALYRVWVDAQRWVVLKIGMLIIRGSVGGLQAGTNVEIYLKDYRKVDGYNLLAPYKMEKYMRTPRLTLNKEKMEVAWAAIPIESGDIIDVKVNTGLEDDLFDGNKLLP